MSAERRVVITPISESVAITGRLSAFERQGFVRMSDMVIAFPSPRRTDFLEGRARREIDITLQALCDRLSAERGSKPTPSMMSRFFRKIVRRLKKTVGEQIAWT